MDKYEFASSILKDLTSRLNRKYVPNKNFKMTTLDSLAGFRNERQDMKKPETSIYVQTVKGKAVITENDILKVNEKQIVLPPGSIITPLAKEAARKRGINIITSQL